MTTDSVGRAVLCAPAGKLISIKAINTHYNVAAQSIMLSSERATEHVYAVDAPKSYLRGVVLDEAGQAVANASVRLANTNLLTLTDGSGRFAFEQIPAREYDLRAEHIAFKGVTSPIRVHDSDLDVVIRLHVQAVALEPVVVTAFSRRLESLGFYDRERRGVGTFMNRKQIEAMGAQNASDLLRRVPGVRLVPQVARRHVANQPANIVTARGNCRFKFIIDGTRTLPDFEMDYLAAGSIEGIEVYNGLSEIPAIFRGVAGADSGPSCGLVALWTRAGR